MKSAPLAITLLLAIGILASCSYRDSGGGAGAVEDLAVFLVEGASDDDVSAVQGLLQVPGEGSEFSLIEGVQGVATDSATLVLYVSFAPSTDENRKSEIESLLLSDKRVDRVVRDYTIPE